MIESHTWFFIKGYARTKINGKIHQFHNMKMNHTPTDITVDHINRQTLNCCRVNLRLVDRRTQSINQKVRATNKTSIMGVSYDKGHVGWVAKWKDADGNQYCKFFSKNKYGNAEAKAMAVEQCQRMIRLLPHYVEALRLNDQ